jgi:hypothetical protein
VAFFTMRVARFFHANLQNDETHGNALDGAPSRDAGGDDAAHDHHVLTWSASFEFAPAVRDRGAPTRHLDDYYGRAAATPPCHRSLPRSNRGGADALFYDVNHNYDGCAGAARDHGAR